MANITNPMTVTKEPRDAVRQQDGRVVLPVLERNDRLARDAEFRRQLLLRHAARLSSLFNVVFHRFSPFFKVKLALHL